MQFKRVTSILFTVLLSTIFVQNTAAQTKTISSNQTGKQGEYHYEYWKDNGTGTMTLGDSCNFSCSWGQVGNILFRKGVRPGARNQLVIYSADYQPTGNSYLSVYGWFKNPLVEYYIIESWGTWKPPGVASKGSVETDGGTYDIYQNTRTGPSIEGGSSTFQQYWSVRRSKHTSGGITCGNHFKAWEAKGMKIGTMYEVSFNVEAYQSSGGKADVKAFMDTGTTAIISRDVGGFKPVVAGEYGATLRGYFKVTAGNVPTVNFSTHKDGRAAVKVYNYLGREVAGIDGKVYSAGPHTVKIDASALASGVYLYTVKVHD